MYESLNITIDATLSFIQYVHNFNSIIKYFVVDPLGLVI